MNIIGTTILAGAFAVMPGLSFSAADMLPTNPLDGISVCAGGLALQIDADGVRAEPSKVRDFEIELRLKSGTPVKVSL